MRETCFINSNLVTEENNSMTSVVGKLLTFEVDHFRWLRKLSNNLTDCLKIKLNLIIRLSHLTVKWNETSFDEQTTFEWFSSYCWLLMVSGIYRIRLGTHKSLNLRLAFVWSNWFNCDFLWNEDWVWLKSTSTVKEFRARLSLRPLWMELDK